MFSSREVTEGILLTSRILVSSLVTLAHVSPVVGIVIILS